MKTPALCLLLAACLLAVSGCSKQTTRTVKTSDGKEVTMSGDGKSASMDVTTATGEKVHLQGSADGMAVPADFPKDIPIFAKSKLRMASGGAAMRLFGFVLPATPADGMAYYEKEFPAQGWETKPHMAMGQSLMLQGSKGGRTFMLTIGPDGKDTYAQLTVTGGN
ncbi:MAG TPA: hypothetical protein VG936_09030 [Lacunisphaera sp.]|nr:hypothetical protein [Lacunisphaera sp.]